MRGRHLRRAEHGHCRGEVSGSGMARELAISDLDLPRRSGWWRLRHRHQLRPT